MVDDLQTGTAQRGVGGQFELAVDAAVVVGRERLGVDLLALGVVDLDLERLMGELRAASVVVLGLANPELELHRLLGPIDGPIGDDEDLHLLVLLVVAGRRARRRGSRDRPAGRRPWWRWPAIGTGRASRRRRTAKPGRLRRCSRRSLRLRSRTLSRGVRQAADGASAVAEELDVRLGHRLAGHGVGDEVQRLVVHRLLDDGRVGHPEDDLARVAVVHLGRDQVRPAFCSGVVTVIRLSKCFGRGSRSSVQRATSAPTYFFSFSCTSR